MLNEKYFFFLSFFLQINCFNLNLNYFKNNNKKYIGGILGAGILTYLLKNRKNLNIEIPISNEDIDLSIFNKEVNNVSKDYIEKKIIKEEKEQEQKQIVSQENQNVDSISKAQNYFRTEEIINLSEKTTNDANIIQECMEKQKINKLQKKEEEEIKKKQLIEIRLKTIQEYNKKVKQEKEEIQETTKDMKKLDEKLHKIKIQILNLNKRVGKLLNKRVDKLLNNDIYNYYNNIKNLNSFLKTLSEKLKKGKNLNNFFKDKINEIKDKLNKIKKDSYKFIKNYILNLEIINENEFKEKLFIIKFEDKRREIEKSETLEKRCDLIIDLYDNWFKEQEKIINTFKDNDELKKILEEKKNYFYLEDIFFKLYKYNNLEDIFSKLYEYNNFEKQNNYCEYNIIYFYQYIRGGKFSFYKKIKNFLNHVINEFFSNYEKKDKDYFLKEILEKYKKESPEKAEKYDNLLSINNKKNISEDIENKKKENDFFKKNFKLEEINNYNFSNVYFMEGEDKFIKNNNMEEYLFLNLEKYFKKEVKSNIKYIREKLIFYDKKQENIIFLEQQYLISIIKFIFYNFIKSFSLLYYLNDDNNLIINKILEIINKNIDEKSKNLINNEININNINNINKFIENQSKWESVTIGTATIAPLPENFKYNKFFIFSLKNKIFYEKDDREKLNLALTFFVLKNLLNENNYKSFEMFENIFLQNKDFDLPVFFNKNQISIDLLNILKKYYLSENKFYLKAPLEKVIYEKFIDKIIKKIKNDTSFNKNQELCKFIDFDFFIKVINLGLEQFNEHNNEHEIKKNKFKGILKNFEELKIREKKLISSVKAIKKRFNENSFKDFRQEKRNELAEFLIPIKKN